MLDRPQPADTGSNVDPDPGRLFRRNFQAGIVHRQLARPHRIVDEGVHLLDFFFLDELRRIEILHLGGNLRIVSARIESRDSADAGLAGAKGLPRLVYAGTKRCHQAKTGHYHTSDGAIVHTVVRYAFSLI